MYGRTSGTNVRNAPRPTASTSNGYGGPPSNSRAAANSGGRSGSMGQSQPLPRGPPSRYEPEPVASRNPTKPQKSSSSGGGGGGGYGEYDYLYKNAPRDSGYPPAMPKFVLCYICGRKYGTQSIEIHEPQCLEKWHFENAKLPPNLRRPAPRKPDLHIGSGASYTLDQINDAAYEASKASLVPCENCGRKFAADRIQVHQRSCKPGNAAKSIGAAAGPSSRMPERSGPGRGNPSYNDEYDEPPIAPVRRGGGGGGFGGSGGNAAGAYPPSSSSGAAGLYPCSVCNRSFASDRIQQHQAACQKANKQRRTFDSTKQRLQGTEAASYFRKSKTSKAADTKPGVSKSNWRQKHEDFIRAIRYAKQATNYEKSGGRLADLPPPPASVNPDYVQCPHCGRNFAPNVAERHIPKCVNILAKPKPPPNMNRTSTQQRPAPMNTRAPPPSNYGSSSSGYGSGSAGYRNSATTYNPAPARSTRGRR